jgi:hypothetical protein
MFITTGSMLTGVSFYLTEEAYDDMCIRSTGNSNTSMGVRVRLVVNDTMAMRPKSIYTIIVLVITVPKKNTVLPFTLPYFPRHRQLRSYYVESGGEIDSLLHHLLPPPYGSQRCAPSVCTALYQVIPPTSGTILY